MVYLIILRASKFYMEKKQCFYVYLYITWLLFGTEMRLKKSFKNSNKITSEQYLLCNC